MRLRNLEVCEAPGLMISKVCHPMQKVQHIVYIILYIYI